MFYLQYCILMEYMQICCFSQKTLLLFNLTQITTQDINRWQGPQSFMIDCWISNKPDVLPDLNQQCSHLNSLAATLELTNQLFEGSTSLCSDEWYFTYVYSWTKRCLVILLRSYTWSIPWRRSSHIWSRLIGRRPCWWELAGLYVAIVCLKNVKCGREAPTPHLYSNRIMNTVSCQSDCHCNTLHACKDSQ